MRDTKAVIQLQALNHNFQTLKNLSDAQVFPVVKANAYGHGMLEIARAFQRLGAPLVCVSSLEEAYELVESGFDSDIMIFSYVAIEDVTAYHNDQFIYSVPSYEWFEEVQTISQKIRLHIELNTGMNRYGVKWNIKNASWETHHTIEGIYTHFSSIELNDLSFQQIDRLKHFIDNLEFMPKWIHVGNAPAALIRENQWINGVRYGLALYGYRGDIKGLQPVLSISTKINHIDTLKAGESLGYNQSYTARGNEIFATVPIGYGDGFDMRNNACPLVSLGKPFDIIGAICMDQTMIRVDDTSSMKDEIEIIGSVRTLDKISLATGITKYVLLTSLSPRIQRIYKDKI